MTPRGTVTVAMFALMAVAWLPAIGQAQACEPVKSESARNRDGSVLSVHTECASEATRLFVIELKNVDGNPGDRLQIEQPVDESPTGGASLRDLAGDGTHVVEVRGSCGAGPNCAGDLYAVSADGRSLTHFFSGGYADLSVRDGWLVESGRASCCSWEFHLWKLDTAHDLPLQYDNMDLMAQVGMLFGDGGDEDRFDCRFSRPGGDSARVVAPPSAALEALCTVYGEDYVLAPPDPLPDPPSMSGANGRTLEP